MTRFHDLDALRAAAMLLGLVLHAAVFLVPVEPWPVHDEWAYSTEPETNPYALAISAIHGFRMPLFFLLSGFFSAMLWQRRGLERLVQLRLLRIGLPLLGGMLTIVPIVAWQFAGSDFKLLDWPLAWLDGLAHLWFLWYLLLMSAAFVVAIRIGLRFRHRLWWLLIPLALVPQVLMQERLGFGADTIVDLLPPVRVFGYYFCFFLFGVFFFQRRVATRKWWAVAVPVAVVPVHFLGLMLMHDERFQIVDQAWAWGTAATLQIVYAWMMCFGSMGLFRLIASRKRYWVRYLSDASYWLYLSHLPLVVGVQTLTASWQVTVHLKYLTVLGVTVPVLLAAYQTGVRYTAVGTLLNGPRTRRASRISSEDPIRKGKACRKLMWEPRTKVPEEGV